MDERNSIAAIVLTALYLQGAPRQGETPVRGWRSIVKSVHRHQGTLGGVSAFLRKEGHWAQALLLETPGLLAWAESFVSEGRVLTAEDPIYPRRWLYGLGLAAPPCLHICGVLTPGPFLGAVGCRVLSAKDERVAHDLGVDIVRSGYSLVSGGAPGADSMAAVGALHSLGVSVPRMLHPATKMPSSVIPPQVAAASASPSSVIVRILPRGLIPADAGFGGGRGVSLSLLPPGARFSRYAALERNALIYSMAEATVIVRSRFRSGGTWAGATEALRRRLGRVFIQEDQSDPAHCALRSLGASVYDPACGIWAALLAPPAQRPLFAVDDRASFGVRGTEGSTATHHRLDYSLEHRAIFRDHSARVTQSA